MQAFQVTKIEAPAKWAHLSAVTGWVEVTDEDGNKAIGALHNDQIKIVGNDGMWEAYSITRNDCRETINAAKALFA